MADTLVNMFHGRVKYPWQGGDDPGKAGATTGPKAERSGKPGTGDDEKSEGGESPESRQKPTKERPN